MDFRATLKVVSGQIIELSGKLSDKVHTWNDEASAPSGGFTDRAGFVSSDEQFDLCADVYCSETDSLLRTRLGITNTTEDGRELFTLITLDYAVEQSAGRAVLENTNPVTQETLTSLLNDPTTVPSRIHVSLASGIGANGNPTGVRYDFYEDTLLSISDSDQEDFLATLHKAYDTITKQII